MELKAIICIALVVFIGGGFVFMKYWNKKRRK